MIPYQKSLIILSLLTFFIFPLQADERILGLHYQKIVTPAQQTIHVVKVDPKYLQIIAVHANEKVLGRETVTKIAKRYKAVAAINGGFFKTGESTDGLPAGVLKIKGDWYGIAYRNRAAIGWSQDLALINRIQTRTTVYINHHPFPVSAVNQPGAFKQAVLYTDAYGKKAGSLPGDYDIVIQNDKIINVLPSGNTIIPHKGYVYTLNAKLFARYSFTSGYPVKINIEVIPQFLKKEQYLAWQMVDYIIGGSPLLLYNGKIIKDYNSERIRSPFISERYARTAVGLLKNGHWILTVVEQTALTRSAGMTIPELASFMKELGAEYALNLDGGSSSTLYINNAIVNHPEGDDAEDYGWTALRPVSDAILILPKH